MYAQEMVNIDKMNVYVNNAKFTCFRNQCSKDGADQWLQAACGWHGNVQIVIHTYYAINILNVASLE